MHNDQESIMNSLRNEGPEAWCAYLHPFQAGEPATGLSMLVICAFAASRAKKQESLEWAEVAVRASELEARHSSGIERENTLLSAMRLRAWFISKKGSRSGHLVLDKDVILHWAMEGVNLPVQTANEKATSFWENLARAKTSSKQADLTRVADDLRALRRMKHRLNVVKVLAECGELPADSPLFKWLEIREQLP